MLGRQRPEYRDVQGRHGSARPVSPMTSLTQERKDTSLRAGWGQFLPSSKLRWNPDPALPQSVSGGHGIGDKGSAVPLSFEPVLCSHS